MYAALRDPPQLRRLALRQSGVVSREQLSSLGVGKASVASQISARRWQAPTRSTLLLHNTTPTRRQLMWIAVLEAGPAAALGAHTSLELCGFRGFAREAQSIHLVVARGCKTVPLPGVVVHESRRLFDSRRRKYQGLPCIDVASSTIDAAAWQRWPRFAVTLLAASVQQRLCTPDELDAALALAGRVRHKRYMRLALADIRGGADSLGEIDVAALCRRFQLMPPSRQRIRRDPGGRRRYLDCEWDLADGSVIVLEIDGTHHHLVEHWEADMQRERKLVISRRWVLRATASEVRLEPASLATDLIDMGVPRLPSP